jgi:hypothetical protein
MTFINDYGEQKGAGWESKHIIQNDTTVNDFTFTVGNLVGPSGDIDLQGSFTVPNRANNAFVEYTKESLIQAFFVGLHNAFFSLASTNGFIYSKAGLYKSGSNYVMEVVLPNSGLGSGVNNFGVNVPDQMRVFLGKQVVANQFIYQGPDSILFNASESLYRFTTDLFDSFPTSDGVEDAIFDTIGEGVKYGQLDLKSGIGSVQSHIHHGINRDWYIRSGKSAGKIILQDTGGHVTIGADAMTYDAKLTVVGYGFPNISAGSTRRFSYNQDLSSYVSSGWYASSIYGSYDIVSGGSIVSTNGVLGASDERIKKEIVDVDDDSALETLRLLKPKKYKYVDEVERGTEPVWGFIAQQVRENLPFATQLRTECLPNIYELANVSASNVITFTNFDTSNLESNAMVLKVYDVDDTEHLVNIAEVLDEHSVRVDEWTGNEGDKIFVYGQQVDDFVFLKKDAIWTVTTSALREVDRQLQHEKARNDALEARILALENA